ncbi:MAG: hypothetical protein AAF614_07545 [Chloroflexota bacterium]
MKIAQTPDGTPLVASPEAPKQAICPVCGGTLTLRSRKTMSPGEKVYYWRHRGNRNRHCSGRTRPT